MIAIFEQVYRLSIDELAALGSSHVREREALPEGHYAVKTIEVAMASGSVVGLSITLQRFREEEPTPATFGW